MTTKRKRTDDAPDTRSAALLALGFEAPPDGLTEAVVRAALTRPCPRKIWIADSAGGGHVRGLGLSVPAALPGPKGRPVPGAPSFYVAARLGRGGKVKQVRVGRADLLALPEARTRARELLNRLAEGVDPTAARKAEAAEERKRVTGLAYLAGDWWEKHGRNRKSGSAEQEKLRATWGDLLEKKLDAVTADDINRVLQARRDDGIADNTVLRDWSAIRSFLRRAKEDGLNSTLPFDRTPPAVKGLQGAKRVRWLGQHDPAEVQRFEDALSEEGVEVQRALKLLALTGMRRAELLGLNKREVRLRDGVAVIPPERSKSGRQRIVRLNAEARKLLEDIKVHDITGAYFPGPADTWKTRLRRSIARIRKAGCPDFKVHDLRHSFAVRARQAGAALEVVRDLLGHADVRSTQIYAHVGESELIAVVAKIKI